MFYLLFKFKNLILAYVTIFNVTLNQFLIDLKYENNFTY